MSIREELEREEKKRLSPRACLSSMTRGRLKPEEECPLRLPFQHDRDRILHSKAFRRLKYKTQVLILPEGDHFRTRMTHTLEVMQIARTIARALRLNEDLTEAIALGHDLGHTPFGHAGEAVLDKIVPGGFRHYKQSLRVVDVLEKGGKGLNLTYEVRDGILKHSKGTGPVVPVKSSHHPLTLEGMVVRISDIIAYLNHDLDDAIRAKIISTDSIPKLAKKVIGEKYSQRINSMVQDVVNYALKNDLEKISFSEAMTEAVEVLRSFLLEKVYRAPVVQKEAEKCYNVLASLFEYYLKNPGAFEKEAGEFEGSEEDIMVRVKDFIAGMTDRYALRKYMEIFVPKKWALIE